MVRVNRLATRRTIVTLESGHKVYWDQSELVCSDGHVIKGLALVWPPLRRKLPEEVSIVHIPTGMSVVDVLPRPLGVDFADALRPFNWSKSSLREVVDAGVLAKLVRDVFHSKGVNTMGDDSKRHLRKVAGRAEKMVADAVGGKRQPGSGVSDRAPRDVISTRFLLEVKTTEKAAFTLQLQDLTACWKEASAKCLSMGYVIEFNKNALVACIINSDDLDDVDRMEYEVMELATAAKTINLRSDTLGTLFDNNKVLRFTYNHKEYEVHPVSTLIHMSRRSEEAAGATEFRGKH